MADQQFHYEITTDLGPVKKLIDAFNKVSTESVKIANVLQKQDKQSGALVTKVHVLNSASQAYSVTIKELVDGQVSVSRAYKLGEKVTQEYVTAIAAAEKAVQKKISTLRRIAKLQELFGDATRRAELSIRGEAEGFTAAKARISGMETELRKLSAARDREARSLEVQNEASRILSGVYDRQKAAMLGVTTGMQAASSAVRGYTSDINALLGAKDYNTKASKDQAAAQRAAVTVTQIRAKTEQLFQTLQAQGNNLLRHNVAHHAALSKVVLQQINAFKTVTPLIQLYNNAQKSAAVIAQQKAAAMRQLQVSYKKLGVVAKDTTKEVTLSWKGIMRLVQVQVLHRIFAALSRFIRDATQEAIRFNVAMAEVQTISLKSSATVSQWTGQLKALNSEFGSPMIQLAEASYQGLSNQIMQSNEDVGYLRETVKLATVAIGTMDQAVAASTSVINAFGMEARDASHIHGTLFKTIEMGRVRLEEMADALGRVSMLSSQLGVTFEEQQAAFATLTIQGVKFNVAQTLLSNVMLKLIKPSERMLEVMDKYGVSSGESAIATYSLAGFMNILAKEANKSNDVMEEFGEMWGRLRAMTGAAGLMFNLETYNNTLDEMTRGAEDFTTALNRIMENPAKKLEIELEKVKAMFQVEWGNIIIEWGNRLTGLFGGLDKSIKVLITQFRNLVIAAVLVKTRFLGVGAAIKAYKASMIQVQYLNKALAAGLSMTTMRLYAVRAAVVGLTASLKVLMPFVAVSIVMALYDSWGKAKRAVQEYGQELERVRMINQQIMDEMRSRQVREAQAAYSGQMQELLRFVAFVRVEFSKTNEAFAANVRDTVQKMTEQYKNYANEAIDSLKDIEDAHKKLQQTIEDIGKTHEQLQRDRLTRETKELELADKAVQARRQAAEVEVQDPDLFGKLMADAEAFEQELQRRMTSASEALKGLEQSVPEGLDLEEMLGNVQLLEEEIKRREKQLERPRRQHPEELAAKQEELTEAKKLLELLQNIERQHVIIEHLERESQQLKKDTVKIDEGREQNLARQQVILAERFEESKRHLAFEERVNAALKEQEKLIQSLSKFELGDDPEEARKQLETFEQQLIQLSQTLAGLDDQAGREGGQMWFEWGETVTKIREAWSDIQEIQDGSLQALKGQTSELEKQHKMLEEFEKIQRALRDQEESHKTHLDTAANAQEEITRSVGRHVDMVDQLQKMVASAWHGTPKATLEKEYGMAGYAAYADLKDILEQIRNVEALARERDLSPQEVTRLTALQQEAAQNINKLLGLDLYAEFNKLTTEIDIMQRENADGRQIDQAELDAKKQRVTQLQQELQQTEALRQEVMALEDEFPQLALSFNALTKNLTEQGNVYAEANKNIETANGALGDLNTKLVELREQYGQAFKDMEAQFKEEQKLSGLRQTQADLFERLNKALDKAIPRINAFGGEKRFARGGLVTGPSGTDMVAARLTAGEYVWDKDTTRKFFPLIKSLHSQTGSTPLTNNYGNINVSIHGADSPQLTAKAVIREMKRELRRGTV